ncbi:MAG: thrombospondin type 3 repeat-containing protein, partial [Thermomicrobiales bacterium]
MHRIVAALVALAWIAGVVAPPFAPSVAADASVGVDSLPVVAQGIVPGGQGSLAWRIEQIDVPEGSVTEQAPAGFVVATGEPLVIRTGSESAQALQAGQATFSGGGQQTRYAWPNATTMWEIALLPSHDAAHEGRGTVIAIGAPFQPPAGAGYDLELLSGKLKTNGTAMLAAGAAPSLVVATAGSVRVEPAGGNSITLERGQAVNVPSRAVLRGASGEDAGVLVVRLTAVTPAPPDADQLEAAPTAAPPLAGDARGSLAVRMRTCPVNTRAADVEAACGTPGTDIGVTIVGPVSAEGRTNAEGLAPFANVPAGSYDVTAQAAGDFAGSYAGCVNGSGTQVADATADRNTFRVRMDPGAVVVCDWYIVPGDANVQPTPVPSVAPQRMGTLQIALRTCPVNTRTADLVAACLTPGTDIGMELAGPVSAQGRTDSDGNLRFTNVPIGNYDLTALVPGDFAGSYATCLNDSGTPVGDPGDNRNTLRIYVGGTVSCNWYIVPDDARGESGNGSISLTATRCQPGYAGVQLDDDCAEPVTDLFVSLAGATPKSGRITDGSLAFDGLAGDTYVLTATIGDERRALYVDCRDADGRPVATPDDRVTTRIVLAADTAISCHATAMDVALWQLFAAAPLADGALTVPVMLCPEPLDPESPNLSPCDTPVEGVGLAVLSNGSSVARDMTGSAWPRWSNLSAGAYDLVADGLPAGYAAVSFAGQPCCSPAGGFTFRIGANRPGQIVPLYLAPAPAPAADSDFDGLDDAQEARYGTDPMRPDTDFDGGTDGAEVAAGTDPTNGLSN